MAAAAADQVVDPNPDPLDPAAVVEEVEAMEEELAVTEAEVVGLPLQLTPA